MKNSKELLNLARSTPFSLAEIKKLNERIEDIEALKKILNTSMRFGLNPNDIINVINSFGKTTKISTERKKLISSKNIIDSNIQSNRNLIEIIIAFALVIVLSFGFYKIGYLQAEKEAIEWAEDKLIRMKNINNLK